MVSEELLDDELPPPDEELDDELPDEELPPPEELLDDELDDELLDEEEEEEELDELEEELPDSLVSLTVIKIVSLSLKLLSETIKVKL